MLKIFLIVATSVILAFVLFAVIRPRIAVGRSAWNENNGYRNKGNKKISEEKQICCKCKTGKESYELDEHSESCPYIGCWNDGKCSFYIPLEYPNTGTIKKIERKKFKKQ